ncbi:MAG: FIST C-terminal domain-containing protein [Candidatus Tectomicrobia bacterium]|nr:FIST C-terminal domain-containing protein [Candidatus Tectomicrobia bacterium]
MKFGSGISITMESGRAVEEVCDQALSQLDGKSADLALLFLSPHHANAYGPILQTVRRRTQASNLLGCTGEGVIGRNQEYERRPAISLLLAHLPDVSITPYALAQEDLEESGEEGFWQEKFELLPTQEPTFLLLPEPFSFDAMTFVVELNRDFPGIPIIGGIASGASQPGEVVLFLNDRVIRQGGVTASLTGNIAVETVVSQGCRPIGQSFVITQGDRNIIYKLSGRPALEVVREMLASVSDRDRHLAQTALLVGRVIDEYKEELNRGDFLIRNLIGADPQSGAIAIGDFVRPGQTIQFHVRDAETASEDLHLLLGQHAKGWKRGSPEGALLFSCNGRGQGLYGVRNHDIDTVRKITGEYPIAGFFCNGEIGPVGGQTFIHGFTSSIGFFRPRYF